MKFNLKEIKMLSIVIAVWGIILIGSGIGMNFSHKTITKVKYSLDVSTKQIPQIQAKKNEIIPKKIQIEEGNPISANIKDYLEEANQISETVLNQLSLGLDTSMVNINQPGVYTYTITYKKKRYQGTVIVNAKPVPKATIVLRVKKLPTTGTISRNIKDYVQPDPTITQEVYNNMILDLEEVAAHLSIPGKYKYKVIYNDTTYYGDFEIVDPVSTGTPIVCPTGSTKENNTCKCTDATKTYDAKTNTCINKIENQE